MRTILVSLSFVFFASTLPVNAELIPPTIENQRLGLGLTSDGRIKNQAVAVPPKEKWEVDAQTITFIKFEFVEDSKQLREKLGVDASASIRAGFGKISARASFAKENACSEFSTYGMVHCKTFRGLLHLPLPLGLTTTAEKQTKNPRNFKLLYGDGFVYGLNQCAEYVGLIEIKSSTLEEKKKLDAELKGKSIAFSGSASLESQLESVIGHRSVKVSAQSFGAPASIPVARSLAELETIPNLWREKVQGTVGNPTPSFAMTKPRATEIANFLNVSNAFNHTASEIGSDVPWNNTDVSVMSYEAVAGLLLDSQLQAKQQRAIDAIGKQVQKYDDQLSNIDFVLNNKGQFDNVDETALEAGLGQINTAVLALQSDADNWLLEPAKMAKKYQDEDYKPRAYIKVPLPSRRPVTYKVIEAQVDAGADPWTKGDTGIVLKPGQEVAVFVSDLQKRWSEGPDPHPQRDANGVASDGGFYKGGDTHLPSARIGELIGRVGKDVFVIGTGTTHLCADGGTLQLMMNDGKGANQDGSANNIGAMNVGIVPYATK